MGFLRSYLRNNFRDYATVEPEANETCENIFYNLFC